MKRVARFIVVRAGISGIDLVFCRCAFSLQSKQTPEREIACLWLVAGQVRMPDVSDICVIDQIMHGPKIGAWPQHTFW